jgi:transposase
VGQFYFGDLLVGWVRITSALTYWKAVVGIAAKNARLAWAVLAKGEQFKVPA